MEREGQRDFCNNSTIENLIYFIVRGTFVKISLLEI
jgi:hypothetical protein